MAATAVSPRCQWHGSGSTVRYGYRDPAAVVAGAMPGGSGAEVRRRSTSFYGSVSGSGERGQAGCWNWPEARVHALLNEGGHDHGWRSGRRRLGRHEPTIGRRRWASGALRGVRPACRRARQQPDHRRQGDHQRNQRLRRGGCPVHGARTGSGVLGQQLLVGTIEANGTDDTLRAMAGDTGYRLASWSAGSATPAYIVASSISRKSARRSGPSLVPTRILRAGKSWAARWRLPRTPTSARQPARSG